MVSLRKVILNIWSIESFYNDNPLMINLKMNMMSHPVGNRKLL